MHNWVNSGYKNGRVAYNSAEGYSYSSRAVVRSDGTVTAKYRDYRAFGWMEDEDINLNQKYKYTGKPFDDEQMIEKMYYHGARYYWGYFGRWLSVDPLLGRNTGVSPYAYCLNNPLKYHDPDGKLATLPAAGAGLLIGAGIGGGVELLNQYSDGNIFDFDKYDFGRDIDWGRVGGSAADGAITGAVAGLTAGLALIPAMGANMSAGVVGGITNRAISGEPVLSGQDIINDAASGAAGAAAAGATRQITKSVALNVTSNRVTATATKAAVSASRSGAKSGTKKFLDQFLNANDGEK